MFNGRRLLPLSRVGLAKTRVTLHERAALWLLPPLKIRSFEFCALIVLFDLGPSTNCIASPQFDLPEPFGPVIAVNPRSYGTTTSPLNDLKFDTSSALRYIPIPQAENKSNLNLYSGSLGVLKYTSLERSIRRFLEGRLFTE